MTIRRIFACIFVLWIVSLLPAFAQAQKDDSADTQAADTVVRFQGVQIDHSRKPTYKEQPVFCGVSVGVDLAGALMAQVAKFGQYDAQARFNFKQRYFAAFEAGVGTSHHTSDRTSLHYNVHAPYFRIGADYNFANNPVSGNRVLAGFRYGFSAFNFDASGPDIQDPVWGTTTPMQLHSQHARVHWGEIVVGLEGRVWRFIHLGWTGRWKFRFGQNKSINGHPFYVPGYGDNGGTTCFGGSFNFIIDISDIKNSKKKKHALSTP